MNKLRTYRFSMKPAAMLLLAAGASSVLLQIVMTRELMIFFSGMEFTMGVIMACWMLLTAAGAFLGDFLKNRAAKEGLLACLAIMPPAFSLLVLISFYNFHTLIFTPGLEPAPYTAAAVSALLLFLPCMSGGMLFSLWCAMHDTDGQTASRAYALEAAGSVAGGLAFYFLSVFWLDSFRLIAVTGLMVSFSALYYARTLRHRISTSVASLVFLSALVLLFSGDFSLNIRSHLFHSQQLISSTDTPQGLLSHTEVSGQSNYFLNRSLLYSVPDPVSDEESVHYAMMQRRSPQKVLLVSGGISGRFREITDWHPVTVEYCDVNPAVIQLLQTQKESGITGVRMMEMDAGKWLRTTDTKYDAILLCLPMPSTLGLNRYYSREFFMQAQQAMSDSGVLSLSLPLDAGYIGGPSAAMVSVLHKTLKSVFSHVLIIPGQSIFFLASAMPLRSDISALAEENKMQTDYVNAYYLDDFSLEMKRNSILKRMDTAVSENSMKNPVLARAAQEYAFSLSGIRFNPPLWLLILLFMLPVLLLKPASASVFAAGAGATSFELVSLFLLQSFSGYIYTDFGLLLAVFMSGLALGAAFGFRRSIKLYSLLFLSAFCCLLIPLLAAQLNAYTVAPRMIIFVLLFALAYVSGNIFRTASRSGNPGRLYGLDLAGAALAAFFFASFVIPRTGMMLSALLIALFYLFTGLSVMLKQKHRKSPIAEKEV